MVDAKGLTQPEGRRISAGRRQYRAKSRAFAVWGSGSAASGIQTPVVISGAAPSLCNRICKGLSRSRAPLYRVAWK